MKIEEFLISDYGPLPERPRFSLGNFNLIYGENESGKTLTMDAIIKMLVGKGGSNFKYINRVDELPEGYVMILEDDGKKTKIKGKKNIKNILDLTFSEFCNLFIIRNSDLEIFKAPDFYNNVTDRLLGLRIKDIEKIRKNLKDIGNLTPSGKFSNKGEEKFEERMKNARKSITSIKLLSKKIKDEDFDKLEESLIKFKTERQKIGKNLTNYENARKREIFEKGRAALDLLLENKNKIEELNVFNENDKETWKTNETNLNIYNPQKKILMSELKKKSELLENVEKEITKKQIEITIPTEIKRKIETDIKREILEFEVKTGDLAAKKEKSKFFNLIFIISSFLLGISLLGGLISSYLLGYLLAGIFGTVSVIFVFFKFQYIKEKGWLDGFIERLNLELLEIGLKGENFEEITSNIRLFEAEFRQKESELNNLKNSKSNLESAIKTLNNTSIPDLELEIKRNEDDILNLKAKSKVESIDAFNVKLGFKQECNQYFENQKAILKNLFGFDVLDNETPILSWSKEIKKLELYKDKNTEVKFNEETVNSLRIKDEELDKQIRSITLTMSEINNELSDIEINVNNILKPKDDFYHCETSNDLEKFKEKLDEFLDENNEKRENILNIIEIFDNIELGEKEKISKLLSKKSSISEYFSEITNGLYNEIRFDMDSATIEVQRKDGEFIKLEYLSGGAYDQLYFSIRLALAEKILKDKTGFFILDDPFIKSDSKRLAKQVELLKKISNLGWQIIYFSSQNDIKNLLTNDIEKGIMNYIELESLFSE